MHDTFLAPETPDLVWFRGDDAARFLDDLISQRVSDLGDGETRRSFLLGPQGKLDHLLWVLRSDGFGLLSESGRGDELATTLDRYRIRVDVRIELETRPVWVVVGPWETGPERSYDIGWPGVLRTVSIGDRPDLPEGSREGYERLRVEAGEPLWHVDVDEDTIPHESGLVPLAVDFTKGCFLGQELVARIDSRGGNTPRRLRHFEFDGQARTGEALSASGELVGSVTSAAGSLGLGMAHRSVTAGDVVTVGGDRATIREIPAAVST